MTVINTWWTQEAGELLIYCSLHVCPHRQHFCCCQPARLSTWLGTNDGDDYLWYDEDTIIQRNQARSWIAKRGTGRSVWELHCSHRQCHFYSLLLFAQQIYCSRTLCDPGKGFIHKLHSGNARKMINKNVSQLGFLYFFWLRSGQ